MSTYEISTLSDLQNMKNHLNDRCVLVNNIDASETREWNLSGGYYLGFEPIGSYGSPFIGSFDGQGYTISNLYVRRSDLVGFLGLVEQLSTLITNGTFTGGTTGWTLGTGWAYGSNNVTKNADGTGTLQQSSVNMIKPIVIGEKYKLTFTLSSFTVGSVDVTIAGQTIGTYTSNGTYNVDFTASTTDDLTFTPSETSRFTLDNVILIRYMTFSNVTLSNIDYICTGNTYIGGFARSCSGQSTTRISFSNIKISGKLSSTSAIYSAGGLIGSLTYSDITDCSASMQMTFPSVMDSVGGLIGGYNASINTVKNSFTTGSINITNLQENDAGIGGFVGRGTGTIENCYSSVGIIISSTSTPTGQYKTGIGGFVGKQYPGTYTYCYATGSITITGIPFVSVGGFVGTGGANKCYATGSIYCSTAKGYSSNTTSFGGFSGWGQGTDCYARGNVCESLSSVSGTIYIGGFCGFGYGGSTRSYSTGKVGGKSLSLVRGGFAGKVELTTCSNCYWDTQTSEMTTGIAEGLTSGVSGKTTLEMKTQSTYTGWDFNTVWEIKQYERGAIGASNLTVWLSRVGDYDRFDAGKKDNDAFELTVPTTNDIRWIGALESLLLGTAGDEWMISSNKLETSLTPTNFKVRQQSEYGSAAIQPIKINSSLMFIDYVARKIREMTQTSENKYESPDLCALAEHITVSGITSVARQKNPDSIVWCTLGDGSLISMTYEREQDVIAWARHSIGGNGFCQSVAVVPGASEDLVYLSVYRTFEGNQVVYGIDNVVYGNDTIVWKLGEKIYLERFSERTYTQLSDAVMCDTAITTSVSSSQTITGLQHLAGEKVVVIADGTIIYNGTENASIVSESGRLTLPAVSTYSSVHIGLPYSAKLRPMRIVLGDSMGSEMRVSELVISVQNAGALKYGLRPDNLISVDLNDVRWKDKNDSKIDGLFTGEVVVSMQGGFDPLVPIYIVSDSPLPLTVRAIVPRIMRSGR